MQLLEGALRSYAWGSRTAIADLCGRPSPSKHPEAELWLGAHPGDPAFVVSDGARTSLLDVIATSPESSLGTQVLPAFGPRLPYLLKILAADEPLSLQAHPSLAQAKEGFTRENRAGVPIDSPVRNYKDESHKPELIVALSPFDALAGFRDPHRTIALLAALEVPALQTYIDLLAGAPDESGLRAVFTTWITMPPPAMEALIAQVLDGCVKYLSGTSREYAQDVRLVLEIANIYPGDAGVLGVMLLNRVQLQAGEGLFLAAGNLHAYLRGLGVELMANSDNVLRGGLTPKHIDVPELLKVLDFRPIDPPIAVPVQCGRGLARYETPAPEFALYRVDIEPGVDSDLPADGPRIVVCTEGNVRLKDRNSTLDLAPGQSAWLPAANGAVTASADDAAVLFCAADGVATGAS
ncbi:mannose-6-phosphate isomerase, class I [Smaragdicoccus niigatensis]|uniref:mannose-6-phosphate isomerase, class I n=1 Tax=Smaragdicoccus niigatensis TaxID=359359 RepID=UPI00037B67A9|nr:mannose-6-phosphate isomerase, class I [Smaragdicoccus niigatensis]